MKQKIRALWDWFKDKGYIVVIVVVAIFAVVYGLATGQGAGVLKKLLKHRRDLDDKRRKIRTKTEDDVQAIEADTEARAREAEREGEDAVRAVEERRVREEEDAHAKVDKTYDELADDAARARLDRLIADGRTKD